MFLCMKSIWKYIEKQNCWTVTNMEWEGKNKIINRNGSFNFFLPHTVFPAIKLDYLQYPTVVVKSLIKYQ